MPIILLSKYANKRGNSIKANTSATFTRYFPVTCQRILIFSHMDGELYIFHTSPTIIYETTFTINNQ